ncbi:endonuclease/exonuclease/phosphatase family protein [Streptococcus loxodontisalivarius]|uniref:Endonuclease/exonuclease/phosphatase family metal-dependent hydrolase n=1 Tax=Streptococcus loxodontisalivarius TaxID=1349415 RepID=A0ABS2PVW0_9STRE|nr:endonuclease/exonuclease/phosphatase family protein [Streptococcus loxodontisalivarius]MBM7643432.1 endonuclease/exonuclease/phosphatase family metal-dependent hydrolase [Streptococcus loxodontisalivarius]
MKKIITYVLVCLSLLLLIVAGYLLYLFADYHRLPDKLSQKVNHVAIESQLSLNRSYTITSFNIGYGSYPADYTFFMDGGSEVRARSRQNVLDNLQEDVNLLESLDSDFTLLQEVDKKGDRSRRVNEVSYFQEAFKDQSSLFTQNYDSSYLFYPVTNPIGQATSGLLTLSKFDWEDSTRYQLPIETNYKKFFDLDRAFSLNRFTLENGRALVIVNVHLSAYMDDQTIQKAQLDTLFNQLKSEIDQGNYIICGGDFNHTLAGESHEELTWMKAFPTEDLPQGLRVVAAQNAATARTLDEPYQEGQSVTGIIDGFLVSDNIEELAIETKDNHFVSSDHNPVQMTFKMEE